MVGSRLYIAEVSDPDLVNPPDIPGTIFIVDPTTLPCDPPILIVGDLAIEDADIRRKPEHDNHDRFQVRGSFTLGDGSNGIDPANEDVTVTLAGFSETIPAGSFSSLKFHRWQYLGPRSGALRRVVIREDGRFLVEAEGIDLTGIDLDNPVPFSLQVGDDIGETTINGNP